ncbi:MAG: threo-3-hydroxy-L-aspartate ammonia-lyase [candidate division Zixibacteria bacterium]
MIDKIKSARERLAGQSNVTPIMTSRTLDSLVGARVFLKCENFQRTGAFKFRGAFNAISLLTTEQQNRGVLTYSSGNHAQAVALVGRLLHIQTHIVMPKDAPYIKREATKRYGANIVFYDPDKSTREEIAEELHERYGYTLIPPFDDEQIVAGQGTVAIEIFDKLRTLDHLLAPCGGGGLLSGSAVAAKEIHRNCKVYGVEPELANDATLSFKTGKLHTVDNPKTIADGTRTPSLGKVTFPLVLKYVDDMITVSEEEIKEAVRFLFFRMKLVVEPSGALGVAALIGRKIEASGRIGVVISGGNIDASTLNAILSSK